MNGNEKGEHEMSRERYSIIFSSLTGNTRQLADAIYETLPKENCDYFGIKETGQPLSEMLYIGFWTDKGNADAATLKLLEALKNKKIFLFGTAGFGVSEEYFQRILNNMKTSIDASNTIVGEHMCQGKMPQSVRDRYVKMKAQPDHMPNIDMLIDNFDQALTHPDENDLNNLIAKIKA